jgi:hypothetical protein
MGHHNPKQQRDAYDRTCRKDARHNGVVNRALCPIGSISSGSLKAPAISDSNDYCWNEKQNTAGNGKEQVSI